MKYQVILVVSLFMSVATDSRYIKPPARSPFIPMVEFGKKRHLEDKVKGIIYLFGGNVLST